MAIATSNNSMKLARLLRENAALRKRLLVLESQATTDSLTGLPNRRAADDRLAELFSASLRHGVDLAVLMIDIDGLKTVNDTLGHSDGDELIKLAATTIRTSIRSSDFAARIGGDEFVVLLPHTPACAAASLAERINLAFRGRCSSFQTRLAACDAPVIHIRSRGGRGSRVAREHDRISGQIGLSAGVSSRLESMPSSSSREIEGAKPLSAAELVERADRALYTAKREGKGCVRISRRLPVLVAPTS